MFRFPIVKLKKGSPFPSCKLSIKNASAVHVTKIWLQSQNCVRRKQENKITKKLDFIKLTPIKIPAFWPLKLNHFNKP